MILSAPIKPAFKAPKRKLPWVGDSDRAGRLPGVCRYVVQPVGSTAYTSAAYIYVHLDGLEEPERGCMSFRPYLSDARRVVWLGGPSRLHTGHDFSSEVWAIGQRLAETMSQRSPFDYLFLVMDAAREELERFRLDLRTEVRARQHYVELLASEHKPMVFKDARLNETPEQLAERREGWARRLPRTEQKITNMLADSLERRAMLESVVLAARHVCARFEPPPHDMAAWFDDALHQRRRFIEAPYSFLYGFL